MPDARSHRVHVDDCDVTLAVCLGGTWRGADLCYFEPPANGKPRPRTPDPEGSDETVVVHSHETGVGVLHSGEAYHYVTPLESGERYTLVVQAMWDDGAAWKRTFLQPAAPKAATAASPASSVLSWVSDALTTPLDELETILSAEPLAPLAELLQSQVAAPPCCPSCVPSA